MAERARSELERRKLFCEARELLSSDSDQAMTLFDLAAAVDVYIPELERLSAENADLLSQNPGLRARLREIFVRRWKEKFAYPRYERLPERMRIEQERWGVQRIKELFP